jgi:hypothetical protein
MAKFLMSERILEGDKQTARLGAGTGSSNQVGDKEVGKAVKMVADSRYDLCAAGDPIEAFIKSVEAATLDNYTVGTVQVGGRKEVLADGLEATAGTGTLAVGDYVVCGTVVAKGTALADESSMKVTKATNQPGAAITIAAVADVNDDGAEIKVEVDAALVKVASQLKNATFGWRVVSLGSAGTGAVGTKVVIARVTQSSQ